MEIKRIAWYAVVAILAVILFETWMHDYPPSNVASAPVSGNAASPTPGVVGATTYVPGTFNPGGTPQSKSETPKTTLAVPNSASSHVIQVKTDVLAVAIDLQGGNIISAQLPEYPISLKEKDVPVQILSNNPDQWYVIQSGLTNTDKNGQSDTITFTAAQQNYVLTNQQHSLLVQLTGTTKNGLVVTKTYLFQRNNYAVQLSYHVENRSDKPWEGSLFSQITRRQPPDEKHGFSTRSYNGAAISSPDIPYEKIPYKTLEKENVSRDTKGGWVAMQQHYFLTAVIPPSQNQTYHYYSHVIAPSLANDANIYVVGLVNPQMRVGINETAMSQATFYIGPETAKQLKALAPGLDHTIDYGWLWPISIILFWIMAAIHQIVKNWGLSIIFTTILIKVVFYWFSAKSFRSMARMRELQPKLQALKERYGADKQALSKATMELYRKEKINPVGGCLPMVVQIPVFIAFYYAIIESVELRQAPFFLWIQDLSTKDPYDVLPILMGASMLLQQWISPTSPDPTQQKMMWLLPIIFTVFFLNFPSGLVLYWFVNNIVQVLQQWYVTKTYEKSKEKLKFKHAKKKN